MPNKPDKSLFWMGKYLSLALTLPASVLAGYLLATFIQHWLHFSFLPVIGILLGMIAGLVKIVQEVSHDDKK
jgi:F0F1-type ATP synthase assembly protein I